MFPNVQQQVLSSKPTDTSNEPQNSAIPQLSGQPNSASIDLKVPDNLDLVTPRREGRDAAKAGKMQSECRYDRGSRKRVEWEKSYNEYLSTKRITKVPPGQAGGIGSGDGEAVEPETHATGSGQPVSEQPPVEAGDTGPEENKPLDELVPLVEDANAAWAKFDEAKAFAKGTRLAAVEAVAKVKKAAQAEGLWSKEWAVKQFKRSNGKPRSWSDIKTLARIGGANDPEGELKKEQGRSRNGMRKSRQDKRQGSAPEKGAAENQGTNGDKAGSSAPQGQPTTSTGDKDTLAEGRNVTSPDARAPEDGGSHEEDVANENEAEADGATSHENPVARIAEEIRALNGDQKMELLGLVVDILPLAEFRKKTEKRELAAAE